MIYKCGSLRIFGAEWMMSALTETPLGLSSPCHKSTGSDCCNVGVQRIHMDFYRRDRPKQTCKGGCNMWRRVQSFKWDNPGHFAQWLPDCPFRRTVFYACLRYAATVSISFLAWVELSTCRGSMMQCSMRIAVYGVKSCLDGSFAVSTAYHLRYHGVLSMSQAE